MNVLSLFLNVQFNHAWYLNLCALIGTMVMKVNATDKDDPTTSNGMVRYMLLNGTDLFTIHEKEGEMVLCTQ